MISAHSTSNPGLVKTYGTLITSAMRLLSQTSELHATKFSAEPLAGSTNLTSSELVSALSRIDAPITNQSLSIANMLARFGIEINHATVSEGIITLASTKHAGPLEYALAKYMMLPANRETLEAISQITRISSNEKSNPTWAANAASISLDPSNDIEAIANNLRSMIRDRFSTNHTTNTQPSHSISPDHMADLTKIQQILNSAMNQAVNANKSIDLYAAIPMIISQHDLLLELRAVSERRHKRKGSRNLDQDYKSPNCVQIRLAPPRLGPLEFKLLGSGENGLDCHVGAEKHSTVRLISKKTGDLAAALATAGWRETHVTCGIKTDWPPLWHGGEIVARDRSRVDSRA